MAISTGMGAVKNDGEGFKFLCLSPTPIATTETDTNIASKIYSTSPMRSAPTLGNFPVPPAIDSQYERSVVYTEQQQHPQDTPSTIQSLPKQQSTEPAKVQQANNIERKDEKERVILRSGKWTAVEETYANILIELFEEGRIDEYEKRMDSDGYNNKHSSKDENKATKFKIENGMTLRVYLSRKLFCSPMRISKKFAGRGIGKLVYMSQRPGSFYRIRQKFGLPSGPMSSQPTTVVWSANDWNKLNRLKEAESAFLILAFPQQQGKKGHSTVQSTPSASNREHISKGNRITLQNQPIMPSPPLTSNAISQPMYPSHLGGYESSLRNNELVHYQHYGLTQKQPSQLITVQNSAKDQVDESWTNKNRQFQREGKRERIDAEKQSSVEVLKDAYFESISPKKSRKIASTVASTTDISDSVRDKKDDAQHVGKPGTSCNRPISDSTGSTIYVPNFLHGFEEMAKPQQISHFDQQIIENSPAYHTSRSFDDFHRFLGKGLSPAIASPPKLRFPNLGSITAGAAIPSIQSSSPSSISQLQRRPRNPQNVTPARIDRDEMNSNDLTPLRKNTRKEAQLSEAPAIAIESQQVQDKNIAKKSYIFEPYSTEPATMPRQPLGHAAQETNPTLSTQIHLQNQSQKASDFPIDGMMFEDFNTLATYPNTEPKPLETGVQ